MSRIFERTERVHSRAERRLVLASYIAGTSALAASLVSAGVYSAAPAEATTSTSCTGDVSGVTVYGGNDQVGQVGTAYPESLQVEVVDTTGCAVSDADVTFLAPTSGASGTFSGGVADVTVATSSSGIATAPTFTANDVTGSFDVEAEVDGYDVDLSLTNSTVGVVSSLSATSGGNQEAAPGTGFADPLVVTVEDSSGNPVDDETVTFAITAGSSGATASFAGAGTSTTAETNEDGQATSPDLTAGTTSGSFTVTASVSGVTYTASFTLTVGSGTPYAIAAGAGTSQETEAGTDFAVPLAVTVTDSDGNDVAGATVTFKAPSSGPTGVFAGAGHTVKVTTNSDGVATAPAFSAGLTAGGYVVTATVTGVTSTATFALVDEARSRASTSGAAGTYSLVTSTGRVLVSGDDAALGSLPSSKLYGSKVVAMAEAPADKGYWLVTAKGKVYAFGDAKAYGSPSGLASPIVGMAALPDGGGYWLVAKDGAVYSYGAAASYGSPAKLHLTKPIVGMAATADGKGYWLAASDGGIFNYGDAHYYGSTGKLHLESPIVGMAAAPGGDGYWLVASDGGVFSFGKATYYGSGTSLSPKPVTAIVPTSDGDGYWVISADGTAAGFGDAGAQGSPTLKATTVVAGAS